MFDAEYFQNALPAAIAGAGEPAVELSLLTGRSHRVRDVVEAAAGYVVLEVFQTRADQPRKPRWQEPLDGSTGSRETFRVAISYESIAEVVVDSMGASVDRKVGFFAT